MAVALEDLDAAGTLAAVESALVARRSAEVRDLELVARWADLHAADPRFAPDRKHSLEGWDRLVRVGGPGTPMVQELCICELAVSREVHSLSTRSAMADVLDLRHRLPRVWAVVRGLRAEVWVARRVAVMSRELDCDAVGLVDAAVAVAIAGGSASRVLEIARAKVIEADPAAHAARVAAEKRRRFVWLSRTDEFGLRQVIARVSAGDAVQVDAMVDLVADVLAARGDESGKDVLRAQALGWLARPAELLGLLLEAQQDHPTDHPTDDPADDPAAEDPAEGGRVGSRALALTTDAVVALRSVDPARLRPQATLYVHLHHAALLPGHGGVARVEGIGPVLAEQVVEFLGHCQVTVKPVIDLVGRVSVDAYEHPEWLKERTLLRTPGDVFPHATTLSRRVDHDHVLEYQPHGPPGQTGDHNTGPLGRRHHRAKTHRGYQVRCVRPGEYLWRTPHGRYRLVDHTGTHVIGVDLAAGLLSPSRLEQSLARLLCHHAHEPA